MEDLRTRKVIENSDDFHPCNVWCPIIGHTYLKKPAAKSFSERFSDVFRGYRKRQVSWNGFKTLEPLGLPLVLLQLKTSVGNGSAENSFPSVLS